MATWIRIVEDAVVSAHVAPANGRHFSLQELQRYVGGYIEPLRMRDGSIMWLNEEGKLKGLPYNPVADVMAHLRTGIAPDDMVVGNVLVATPEESGEDEEDEDDE